MMTFTYTVNYAKTYKQQTRVNYLQAAYTTARWMDIATFLILHVKGSGRVSPGEYL